MPSGSTYENEIEVQFYFTVDNTRVHKDDQQTMLLLTMNGQHL